MKSAIFAFLFIVLFSSCRSKDYVAEPAIHQYTFHSDALCIAKWTLFCYQSKPGSLLFRGVTENSSGEKKYFLDYYMDSFDTDFPVGVSLKLGDTFYNLRRAQTEYGDVLQISSEVTNEVIEKILSADGPIVLSYSSRRNTENRELTSGDSARFKSEVKRIHDLNTAAGQLKIVSK